jgi:CheY-like chemotaxis protein
MFEQDVTALPRSQGGLGIGLALARSLVQAHGGTIHARSDGPGLGAEFTVSMPLHHAMVEHHDEVPGTQPAQPIHHGVRALIVEDNLDVATSFAELLKLEGFEVVVVGDGGAALAAAEADPPDVVFLDLGLPDMSGFDVCKKLRASPQVEHATIVAISGWGQEGDRRKSAAAGFDAHLVKPIEVEALLKVLMDSQADRSSRSSQTPSGQSKL